MVSRRFGKYSFKCSEISNNLSKIFRLTSLASQSAYRTVLMDWPNSLDCTDLYQCGARRDAELCRLCYKQFWWSSCLGGKIRIKIHNFLHGNISNPNKLFNRLWCYNQFCLLKELFKFIFTDALSTGDVFPPRIQAPLGVEITVANARGYGKSLHWLHVLVLRWNISQELV